MPYRPNILVIDDEVEALELLSFHLEREGYEVMTAASGIEGLRQAYAKPPDAVILDLRMPGMDGREVCARLRDITDAPIIIVSVITGPEEAVRVLELGADDYLTKPIQYAELSARLAANLRRRDLGSRPLPGIAGTWKIDESRREVIVSDRRVQLTPKEFVVFKVFMKHPEEVLSVDEILLEAWGSEYEGDADLVKQFVYRLRSKLEFDSTHPKYFVTVRGSGYIFEPGAAPDQAVIPERAETALPPKIAAPSVAPFVDVEGFRQKARRSFSEMDTPVRLRKVTPGRPTPTPTHIPKIGPDSVTIWTRMGDAVENWRWRIGDWFAGWPRVNTAYLAAPTAILVMVVVGGVVQAATAALPGDGVYPVKLLVEQAQLMTTVDESRSLDLRLQFLQRRLEEITLLAESGRTAEIPEAVVRLQGEVEQTISTVPQERLATARSPIVDSGLEALIALRDQSPTELEPTFSSAIEATRVLRSRMLLVGHPKLATDLVTRMTVDSLGD